MDDVGKLKPEMKIALPVIENVWKQIAGQVKLEYTATTGAKELWHHAFWSAHHGGYTVDIRTRTLPDKGIGIISNLLGPHMQAALDKRFGPGNYTVIVNDAGLMNPHLHVQYNHGTLRGTGPVDHNRNTKSTTV